MAILLSKTICDIYENKKYEIGTTIETLAIMKITGLLVKMTYWHMVALIARYCT